MNIHFNLFDSIIHRNLRPWLLDANQLEKNIIIHKAKLKHHSKRPYKFLSTFKRVFAEDINSTDLEDIEFVIENTDDINDPIHPKIISFPSCYDDISDFYNDLIKSLNECILFAITNFDFNESSEDEAKSQISSLIRRLQVLSDDINREQRDDELTTYVFNLLRLSLFNIFSQILYFYVDYIDHHSTLENKFLKQIAPNYHTNKDSDNSYENHIKEYKKSIIKVEPKAKPQPEKKLSFHYKYPDSGKLKNITRQLQLKIDLLKTETDEEDFLQVMTADDLSKTNKKIFLNVETTQFRYIIDKLQPYFYKLTLDNIEKSQAFYSKRGTLIKASNLSRNKNDFPKEKEEIDSIFKEVQ